MVTSCGTNMDIQVAFFFLLPIASCVFGDGCLFPCRCNDQATCDPHTGSCSDSQCRGGLPLTPDDPGRFNWRGPACQIGNVAYGKPSAQSGVYEGMVSGYAVDGVIGGTREAWYHGCAHTDHEDGEAAWLYVNLQSLHQIHNVTVYNTFDSGGYPRMSNFSIRVGNTSDVNQHTECARKWETVGPGGLASLECQEKGRFVSFRREGGNEINLVTICEFVVIGEPITKEDQCLWDQCLWDQCLWDQCVWDQCLWYQCCKVGYFGHRCTEECGKCKNDACSTTNGHCSDGCQLWFIGDLCKIELRRPTLGGLYPSVRHLSKSSAIVTWTQDLKIPSSQSQYFGYTVTYAEGSGGFIDGPSVAHGVSAVQQSMTVSNIYAYRDYRFKVRIYREMDGKREYGWPSESTLIQLTTGAPSTSMITGLTDSFETTAHPSQTSDVIIAISAALGFLLFVFVVVILVLFSKRDRTKSSSRSTATVDQASPVAEGPAYANLGEVPSKANYAPSNHYESLTLDPMNDGNNQYASIEADYEEISEKDLS
ncbi:hypothetical protein CAPTEDRAFT_227235 [Capitella teleta]|uniref:Fibronectin type-III domain-containing protein n=1 Tax=Capitella teleta TaxID=283909 RepID=R7UDP6_CAPTE|nr:hypothetical protein CAPTEDRAFT_227235 [Capitella teleta]|eukprot:ELU01382.1 hypothetical protein CAPTEDRAFT_227235 [Capitella teleta]